MKRWRRSSPTFSRSGEASDAADGKGKDEWKQQQRASSGDEISASRSVSSREEATGRPRRPRKNEEFYRRKVRKLVAQRKKSLTGERTPKESSSSRSTEKNAQEEVNSSFPINLTGKIDVGDTEISSDEFSANRSVSSGKEATGRPRRPHKKEKRILKLVAQQKKSLTVTSTPKESHSAEKNAWKEESSSSDPSRFDGFLIGGSNEGGGGWQVATVPPPYQEQQVKLSGGSSNQSASNCEGDALVATEASAAQLSEVVGGGSTGDILKEGCLDVAKLLSRSESVESQEQTSFDQETNTLLGGENNKKPSSGELGKIARDEHSGKMASYGDIRKMIAHDEDEQHSTKIGVPATEDLKQGKEGTSWRALLEIDDDTISQKTSDYFAKLRSDHPDDDCDYLPPYEPHQLTEVYEQLALYRIRGYQLSVDRQLPELDDENLKKHYSSADLFDEGYFEYYEEHLEWYFDPELCKCPGYDDYQRLVLSNHGEYLDWDYYHSILNTYEKDLAYVQYCEALAKETKWIEDYLAHSTHQWRRVRNVAFLQALQIATGFTSVSPRLVLFAFDEYIWNVLFNHSNYKDMDDIYFEIWKRVAKLKKDLREALLEIHRENIFPLRALEIVHELEDKQVRVFYMKDNYDAFVAEIDEKASDNEARQDIKDALLKMIPKQMSYLDYIHKKIDIANDIGLIKQTPPQLSGDQVKLPYNR